MQFDICIIEESTRARLEGQGPEMKKAVARRPPQESVLLLNHRALKARNNPTVIVNRSRLRHRSHGGAGKVPMSGDAEYGFRPWNGSANKRPAFRVGVLQQGIHWIAMYEENGRHWIAH